MLLVIAGAGASFDSIPTRPLKASPAEPFRPPLADELFEPRDMFEAVQREVPRVMQIAPNLYRRLSGVSVEDVLGEYAAQTTEYRDRLNQLTSARFYIQAVVAGCEDGWYRNAPVATNMMALIDQIERFRKQGRPPLFVTFNYDRIIESALANRGQAFNRLDDYIADGVIPVFKLHGSVDWARPIQYAEPTRFGGNAWQVARQICDAIHELPNPGSIERWGTVPTSHVNNHLAVPAIAIPVKSKTNFECPESHLEKLAKLLPEVSTVLTIGWRGGEEHFLQFLFKYLPQGLEFISVGKGSGSAEEAIGRLQKAGFRGHFEAYNAGFSDFVASRKVERLCRLSW